MTTVKFHTYPDGRISMTVSGHAGFAPRGQDILCAAVSVLTLTAAQTAGELQRKNLLQQEAVTVLQEGFACITLRPKAHARGQARAAFRVILTGMRLLARSYPQYVQVNGRV